LPAKTTSLSPRAKKDGGRRRGEREKGDKLGSGPEEEAAEEDEEEEPEGPPDEALESDPSDHESD